MGKKRQNRPQGVADIILPAVLITIVLTSLQVIIDENWLLFSDGQFADPDVYSWFLRVEALQEGQGWFDHTLHRVNPPDGHIQHWTRPLDALLWVGALLLAPFFGFRDGLALWGNIISPLLHLLVLWPMWRLARFMLSFEEAAWALGAFALYRSVLESFQWGRADHHSLLILGQVVFFWAFIRFFIGDDDRLRNAFICGLIGAFAIWVNLEALFYVLVGLACLGLYWVWGYRDLLKASIVLSAGLALGMAVGAMIEWGPEMLERHPVDTISVIYVVVFVLTTGFWATLWYVDDRSQGSLSVAGRLLVVGVCAAFVMGGIYLFSPELFQGPFHMVEGLYRETRLKNIGEQLPMLKFQGGTGLEILGGAVSFLYLLPVALWMGWRKLQEDISEKQKWLWGTMSLMALICALLAQFHAVRWIVYMPLGGALGYGVFCHGAYHWMGRRVPSFIKGGLRPVAVFLLLLSPMLVGVVLTGGGREEVSVELPANIEEGVAAELSGVVEECDARGPAELLNDRQLFPEPVILFVDPTHGAEFLYRTEHFVLGIANHRPQPGFRLFVETMKERDFVAAHHRLVERGVSVMLLCSPDISHRKIWGADSGPGEAPSLMEVLMTGTAVDGFELMADPLQAQGWWVYGVEPSWSE